LSAFGLVTGFFFDMWFANRPDSASNNLYLLSVLGVAALFIILLNLRLERRRETHPTYQPLFFLLVLQFCFGGLASNLLVLYGRSGTLAGSTLFLLLLGAMLVGNEFMKTRYAQLRFNIVVYYTLLFSYLLIAVPTFVTHAVGTWVFLLTGAVSLALIAVFLFFVYFLVFRKRDRGAQIYEVSVLIGCVFVLFNAFYFLNIIPPVPLSLKHIGVYHTLVRNPSGNYTATYEPSPWFIFWRDTGDVFRVSTAGTAVCFSSVFAPTGLSAPIFHQWEKYDEDKGRWETVSRISFAISGGRDAGYRGYTDLIVTPGRWRCNVETQSGALIGRISFTVRGVDSLPAFPSKTL
jgi:hypothetical protein